MKKPARPDPNTSHQAGEYFVAAELSEGSWAVGIVRFWVYQLRDEMPGCIQRVQDWHDSK